MSSTNCCGRSASAQPTDQAISQQSQKGKKLEHLSNANTCAICILSHDHYLTACPFSKADPSQFGMSSIEARAYIQQTAAAGVYQQQPADPAAGVQSATTREIKPSRQQDENPAGDYVPFRPLLQHAFVTSSLLLQVFLCKILVMFQRCRCNCRHCRAIS